MNRKQLTPALVLLLCILVILFLIGQSLSRDQTSLLWNLLAAPAVVIGKLAWTRMRRS
jgi:hypothetical protein